jgi:hypothetical protein
MKNIGAGKMSSKVVKNYSAGLRFALMVHLPMCGYAWETCLAGSCGGRGVAVTSVAMGVRRPPENFLRLQEKQKKRRRRLTTELSDSPSPL